jgi:phosphatidylserine/phosphatidylglycerophosphate/cardiolipin synthase-like enzyme
MGRCSHGDSPYRLLGSAKPRGNMRTYVLTLKQHPWLLPAVEDAFKHLPASSGEDVSKVVKSVRADGGRPLTDGDALIALNALCDLGILQQQGIRYTFDRDRFAATEEMRTGVQAAVQILGECHPDPADVQLCVSLPPALSPAAEHVIRETSTDLRSSLLDVIASARQSLIVASPFWDASTTAEMVALVRKKLASDVQVSLLGRFSRELPSEVRAELEKLRYDPRCAILSWFEGEGAETQTFHFKAISADRGERAYLGSANMTFSSLRSRMELGVILRGPTASELDRILRVVLTMATPIRAS